MVPEIKETKFYDTYRILFCETQDIIDGSYKYIKEFKYDHFCEEDLTFGIEV